MTGALVFRGAIVLPTEVLEDGVVVCRDGRIAAVGRKDDVLVPEDAEEIDARGRLIAPGYVDIHVHGGAGADFIVTDSSRALDMPPGRYRFGPKADGEWFESDGAVGFQADRLASSVTGMDQMVRNMEALTSATVVEAVRMASLTPAERAGIADEVGSLEVGKRADVLVLSPDLAVERVFIGGAELG